MEKIRDLTELSMIPKSGWTEEELKHFHHAFQQISPYLNKEGQSLYKEIVLEIGNRKKI